MRRRQTFVTIDEFQGDTRASKLCELIVPTHKITMTIFQRKSQHPQFRCFKMIEREKDNLNSAAQHIARLLSFDEIGDPTWTDIIPHLQTRIILTSFDPLDQLFWIEISTDRILGESRAAHVLVRFLGSIKIIDLRLQHIAVGVVVVKTRSNSMIDAPDGRDAPCLSLTVGQQERREVREREGDVLQAAAVAVLGRCGWEADQCDAVVFVVVGDEG